MSLALSTGQAAPAAPRLRIGYERIRIALLWLTAFSGAFVFIEPSPYEIVSLGAILIFAASGLTLSATLIPLALLLISYNIGFAIASSAVLGQPKTAVWVLVSCYLSTTALFFAAALGTNTQARVDALMRGTIAAGVVASLVAIAAYFHLLGSHSDTFLLYERARGTFNDPNVLGAFLILPGLLLLYRVLAAGESLRAGLVLILILAALFLSFSRGAWGNFLFSTVVLMTLLFITSRSATQRLRIVLLAALGTAAVACFLVALLSIDQVADLFRERASLEQSYDVGPTGRFGRQLAGFLLALERPFGLGPLEFSRIFWEDPHNAFLNAFISGGWVAGLSYLTLTGVTLVLCFRFAFMRTPWQPVFQVIYAAYVGVVGESFIIDSDHWRHYFLLLGVLWGLVAASQRYQRAQGRIQTRAAPPTLAPSAAQA